MENILIAGATGDTGKRIVEILNNSESFSPLALIRKEEQRQQFEDMEVEAVMGDLEGDVSHVMKGIDKVIFAAGSGGGTSTEKTLAVDRDGAKKLIDAAKNANIKKFIMLSSMGADDPSKNEELKDYLEAKKEADEYLRDSGLNYTIVRPGALTDDLGLAKVEVAKGSLNKRGEISRDDVAFILVMSLADPLVKNMTFEAIEGEESIKSALVELTTQG
jgi:uncharacterized protein YbjT (DUF2867 family)